jgi:hypothetical protein
LFRQIQNPTKAVKRKKPKKLQLKKQKPPKCQKKKRKKKKIKKNPRRKKKEKMKKTMKLTKPTAKMNKTKLITGIFSIGLLSPAIAYAQEGTQTPLGEVSTFGELVSLIWAYGSNVIVALAIFFVVLGAFFYIASAGNEERIRQGKEMIFGALIAIVVVMLSGVLIRTLHKPAEGTTGALAEVPDVIGNATNILIGIIGAFTILMLIYAAFMYLTGRGETDKIEKAHNAFRYALYGLIIGILAYAITNAVIGFLL